MEEEHRGIALVILGIIAIIAVIGLVLMFTGANRGAGAIFTSATGEGYICPISTAVGQPQWLPILAGAREDGEFVAQWQKAGFECIPASAADEYGYPTWCCREPVIGEPGINPQVLQRGPMPLTTRQGFGVPVGSDYLGQYPKEYPYGAEYANQAPRVGP